MPGIAPAQARVRNSAISRLFVLRNSQVFHTDRPIGGYASGWFGVDTGVENIYRFESVEKDGTHHRKTTVIEFDNVNHREIIKSPKFLSLLVQELVSQQRLEAMERDLSGSLPTEDLESPTDSQLPPKERLAERVAELIQTEEELQRRQRHAQLEVLVDEAKRTEDESLSPATHNRRCQQRSSDSSCRDQDNKDEL